MLSDNEKQDLLGRLIIDNPDLDALESALSEFNIFEVVGMVRQEIRHSNFLAFLLNPSETHRMGDLFLKKLLICALLNAENSPLSAVEIDIADLEDAEVRREWRNIDILIYSPANRLVCAIENKVDSSEHSNQLSRYAETVSIEFPSHTTVLIYLTKDGYEASNAQWLSFSYEQVADVIESICRRYQSTIGNEVFTLMNHYVNLIRRHIVSSSEIVKLCQRIYKQHRQALGLIYEHRPDLQSEISEFLQEIIQNDSQEGIELDDSTKQFVRFAPKEWDSLPFQKTCDQWTSSKRIVLFEFVNDPRSLRLDLVIGPDSGEIKPAIFRALLGSKISGITRSRLKPDKWSHICSYVILSASDYEDIEIEGVQEKIQSFWKKYINNELKQIRQAISELQLESNL